MPVEKSAGAVVVYNGKQREYLLLLYPSLNKKIKNYWDLPKGHIEGEESEIETIRREIIEETGLKDIKIVPQFRKPIKYFFSRDKKTIFKTVIFYLVKSNTKEVSISPEHLDYIWLDFYKAYETITYKNAKKILKSAEDFLEKRF